MGSSLYSRADTPIRELIQNAHDAILRRKRRDLNYKGRIGIFEFLQGGPDIEETILKEASEVSLRAVAKKQEMVTMQEDGILKVLEGKTTIDEVKGATGEIEW